MSGFFGAVSAFLSETLTSMVADAFKGVFGKLFGRRMNKSFRINAIPWYRRVIQPARFQLDDVLARVGAREYRYSTFDNRGASALSILECCEDPDTLEHFLRRNLRIARQMEIVCSSSAGLNQALRELNDGLESLPSFRDLVSKSVDYYNSKPEILIQKYGPLAYAGLDRSQTDNEIRRLLINSPDLAAPGSVYEFFHEENRDAYKNILEHEWVKGRSRRIESARMKLIRDGRLLKTLLDEMSDLVRDNFDVHGATEKIVEEETEEILEGVNTPF